MNIIQRLILAWIAPVCLLLLSTALKAEQTIPQNPSENTTDAINFNYQADFYLTLGVLRQQFSSSSDELHAQNSSVGLGYRLSPQWQLQASYFDAALKQTSAEVGNTESLNFDAIYQFQPLETSHWLIDAGFGLAHNQLNNANQLANLRSSESSISVGGGYQWPLNANLAVRLLAKSQFTPAARRHDASLGLSLIYEFAPTPSPHSVNLPQQLPTTSGHSDSDHDGVWDTSDRCPNTPQHYLVDQQGCTRYRLDHQSVNLLVNFSTNSAHLASRYWPEVASLARFMQQHPKLTVTLNGHTDDKGTAAYNLKLSQLRARSVAALLIEHFGVDAKRVAWRGFGESQPLQPNQNDLSRQQNRRVEAHLETQAQIPELKSALGGS